MWIRDILLYCWLFVSKLIGLHPSIEYRIPFLDDIEDNKLYSPFDLDIRLVNTCKDTAYYKTIPKQGPRKSDDPSTFVYCNNNKTRSVWCGQNWNICSNYENTIKVPALPD